MHLSDPVAPHTVVPFFVIKDLKKIGALPLPGAGGITLGGSQLLLETEQGEVGKFLIVRHVASGVRHSQRVAISETKRTFGIQYFFVCPVVQERCSKLYWHQGQCASWVGHFGPGRPNRATMLAVKKRRLLGGDGRGPARGRNRQKLVATFAREANRSLSTHDAVISALGQEWRVARKPKRSHQKGGRDTSLLAALMDSTLVSDRELLHHSRHDPGAVRNGIAEVSRPKADWDKSDLEGHLSIHLGTLMKWPHLPNSKLWGLNFENWIDGVSFKLIGDFRDEARPFLVMERIHEDETDVHAQRIDLVAHPASQTRKLMLCPFAGTRHDILFFRNGIWGSRMALNLQYQSQLGGYVIHR